MRACVNARSTRSSQSRANAAISSRDGQSAACVTPSVVERSGIDASLEDALEAFVDRPLVQAALVEGEKTERRNVTFVEREGVAQRNRPVVKFFGDDQLENLGRAGPVTAVRVEQAPRSSFRWFLASECPVGTPYSVPRFSCSRSIETKSALKLPFPNERLLALNDLEEDRRPVSAAW